MEDILIITNSQDIPIAEIIANDLAGYKVYYFDPSLADQIEKTTLRNAELIIWDACPDFSTLLQSARTQAFAFERELDQSLRAILPECSIMSWQHLNLYYFFMAYHWYSCLWRDVPGKLGEGKPYVFISDNPANYYWPSFMPTLLLLQQLKTFGIPFSAVTYGKRPDDSDLVMNLCDGNPNAERYDLLTHLPTCFKDIDYLNAELHASGKTNINILPKYWGVALNATKNVNLIRLADQPTLGACVPKFDTIASQLNDKLETLLTPYIATPDFRTRQVRHLSNLYQSQLVSLHLLKRYFQQHKPAKMLLSDYDAGFHGPLISFAESHDIPVFLTPHAKISNHYNFNYSNITSLTHPIQSVPPVNASGKLLLHYRLCYPESFSCNSAITPPLRKIGLLLNGLSLNGVIDTAVTPYIDGVKRINQWCKQHGVELSIRCRPGEGLTKLLAEATGMERAVLYAWMDCPLQTFMQDIDLCLMYDNPTSGMIEFLRTGLPILNPIPAPPSNIKLPGTTGADNQVVPRANVKDTLEMLDSFIVDINRLHLFRTNQFADYVSLFKQTYPLRRLL